MTNTTDHRETPSGVLFSGAPEPSTEGTSPTPRTLDFTPHITASGTDIEHTGALRGVSYRGWRHSLCDEPRQDTFGMTANESWVFMAVADGVGESSHSQHGAETAVQASLTLLAQGWDPDEGASLLAWVDQAASQTASTHGVPDREVATTLTIAAIARTAEPDGTRAVRILALGDSPALVLRHPQAATKAWQNLTEVASEDDPGAVPTLANLVEGYVPGRTATLRQIDAVLFPGDVLVLASDGFSIPLGDGTGPLGQDLAARWLPGPRPIVALLIDLSFDTYHDDRTVVAFWNPPSAGEPSETSPSLDVPQASPDVA